MLNVSEANPQWKIVQELELPVEMNGLKGVTIGSDFFISGGGYFSVNLSDKIMKMSCNNGTFQLETLASTLQAPRVDHIFLPLPASMVVC